MKQIGHRVGFSFARRKSEQYTSYYSIVQWESDQKGFSFIHRNTKPADQQTNDDKSGKQKYFPFLASGLCWQLETMDACVCFLYHLSVCLRLQSRTQWYDDRSVLPKRLHHVELVSTKTMSSTHKESLYPNHTNEKLTRQNERPYSKIFSNVQNLVGFRSNRSWFCVVTWELRQYGFKSIARTEKHNLKSMIEICDRNKQKHKQRSVRILNPWH